MPQDQITLLVAFLAGFVSFVSPCVLPLVPAYISNLSGVAWHPGSPSAQERARLMLHGFLFVLGFSTVFILFWTSIGLIGFLVKDVWNIVRIVGGIVLVLMGFHTMGVWRIPFLEREVRGNFPAPGRASYPRSFVTGVIFAAGWAPCIGPVLAGILGLATLRDTVWQGTHLLAAYSAGLAIPFLGTALAMAPALRLLRRFQSWHRWIAVFSGLFLILVGLLMLTNLFIYIPRYFYWGSL